VIVEKKKLYDPVAKRLIYIMREATPDMWHELWGLNENNLRTYMAKKDKSVVKMTARYLKPQDGIVLEGGCGYGGKVNSLMQAGYNVIGLDFDFQTVSFLNKHKPELNIFLGDVRNLSLADSAVAGYWSIGVIEHFFDGYDDIAREMVRVIRPGGYLFLVYPHMSLLRKVKAKLGLYPLYRDKGKPKHFYQFALDHYSVKQKFTSMGFNLLFFKRASGLLGFNEEVPFGPAFALRAYRGKNLLIKGLRYMIGKVLLLFASHVCLMVFQLSESVSTNE
jgi:SAM-dependent methyltransferase